MAPLIAAALIGGGASLLSGLLSKKGSSKTSGTINTSSTPTFAPEASPLRNALLGSITNRLRTGVDQRVLEAQGISHANNVFRNISAGQNADLTGRGLEGSPVAGAVAANTDAARGGSIVDWLNQVPGIARQQQGQDLALGGSVLDMFKGSNSTQTQQGQNLISTGGGAAGGMEGLGGALGMLMAMGYFKPGGAAGGGGGFDFGAAGKPPSPYGYG